MTYKDRTKAFCASILLILKNATVIIPVLEGIVYTIIDMIQAQKKIKSDTTKVVENSDSVKKD